MTSGVPVLASDISGNRGMLGEDYAGYFPAGDAAAAEFLDEYARLSLQCAAELKGTPGLSAEHDAALYAARAKWAASAVKRRAGEKSCMAGKKLR